MSGDGEHEAFALSRSSNFVFEPSNDTYFSALDSHAESTEGDVKLPYVVLGSPGSGKSALLANWVQRRKLTKHRDEFLFQHYVGSSPKSKTLFNLLSRLESHLKDKFQLREMEVPTSEVRLRWALRRFLSSAAKKGKCPLTPKQYEYLPHWKVPCSTYLSNRLHILCCAIFHQLRLNGT